MIPSDILRRLLMHRRAAAIGTPIAALYMLIFLSITGTFARSPATQSGFGLDILPAWRDLLFRKRGFWSWESIGVLRESGDELSRERLVEADVSLLVALLGARQLDGAAGPVDRVDHLHSAVRPAFGRDVVHRIVEDLGPRAVEDERLLMFVVA